MTNNKDALSEKEVEQLSGIEFQSQSYASFYNTTMEKDKSILTLSVAGIGFLVTLLKLSGSIAYYELAFFIIAAICFLTSIYCVVDIFGKNSEFIIDLVNKRDVQIKQYKLDILDKTAIKSFYLGIVMSLLLGASTSITLVSNGEVVMSGNNEQNKSQTVFVTDSCMKATDLHKSFQGATDLQSVSAPQAPVSQGQVSGAAAMMPQPTESDSK
ncbi:hypothetical protein V6255_11240 [Psychromonas arctica]|uniref:Uncharacterized protein n=1 Tax=Psychromonas arctica TaxID=168275 RepID=A0ABU9HCU0_9GAMM